jgi:hypothetical protein
MVLISLIANTIEPFALVDKDDKSPTSVPNELKVVLKLSNVCVVATLLTAILLYQFT